MEGNMVHHMGQWWVLIKHDKRQEFLCKVSVYQLHRKKFASLTYVYSDTDEGETCENKENQQKLFGSSQAV